MANKIQLRRGNKADLPALREGEPGFTLDTGELYIGSADGNRRIGSDGKKTVCFTVGTSTAGHSADDVDYLCDGANDEVQINAAIAALPSSGGEILLREGTYCCCASILLTKPNVSLRGCGTNTVISAVWQTEVSGGLFSVSGANAQLCDLQLDGSGTDPLEAGITLSGGGAHLNGIRISGFSPNLNINSDQNILHDCFLGTSTGDNAIINGNGNQISANQFEGSYDITFSLSGNDNTVTGNRIYDIALCDSIAGSRNAVTGNAFIGGSEGLYLSDFHDGTFTGNVIYGRTGYDAGLYLTGCTRSAISGNTVNGQGDSVYGIWVKNGSNYNTISANTCIDNAVGIRVEGSNGNVVTDNICMRGAGTASDYNGFHTIYIDAASSGNYFCSNVIPGKDYTDQSGGQNTIIRTPADNTLSNVDSTAFYDKAIALGLADVYMLQAVEDVAQANRAYYTLVECTGSGDIQKIQTAINNVPANSSAAIVVTGNCLLGGVGGTVSSSASYSISIPANKQITLDFTNATVTVSHTHTGSYSNHYFFYLPNRTTEGTFKIVGLKPISYTTTKTSQDYYFADYFIYGSTTNKTRVILEECNLVIQSGNSNYGLDHYGANSQGADLKDTTIRIRQASNGNVVLTLGNFDSSFIGCIFENVSSETPIITAGGNVTMQQCHIEGASSYSGATLSFAANAAKRLFLSDCSIYIKNNTAQPALSFYNGEVRNCSFDGASSYTVKVEAGGTAGGAAIVGNVFYHSGTVTDDSAAAFQDGNIQTSKTGYIRRFA